MIGFHSKSHYVMSRVTQFRIAVVGLESSGKSGIIQRLAVGTFSDTPHTESEEQSTCVWDKSFVFIWEFPASELTTDTAESSIVGFGGIIFAFDLSQSDLKQSKSYLASIVQSQAISKVPLLLVGTKSDLVANPSELKPSFLMNELTENLKKTQLLLTSAKDGEGFAEIKEWIQSHALECSAGEALLMRSSVTPETS
jgi:GTPase SAR1 family protein